ncbi:SDR family oxidoreductase [Granulicella arctica]|uniref:SDR family oxidoreductase n=1 Tax=Granulicella arctica TaxID=940613 RepID=UPI0021E000E9|nr:SDR family oxidoreductase [Granulicella arctica]
MILQGNTILITGGGSGIVRGLAEAFHRLGNQVIITGRRQTALDGVTRVNPGMRAFPLDVTHSGEVRKFGRTIAAEFPALNILVNNAGIQSPEKLRDEAQDLKAMEGMVQTNLIAPVRLTKILLPLLERQQQSTIINVTSALAFLPLAGVPTYCATKAAMHSYTQSLRYQLRSTPVRVMELIPPYVQTDLGPSHGVDPRAMPLPDFIAEVFSLMGDSSEAHEIVVARAKPMRDAAQLGNFERAFQSLNEAIK